jgi:lipoate-protein ligase A
MQDRSTLEVLTPSVRPDQLWRIEIELEETGQHNMNRDEELTRELIDDQDATNCLRLYSWKPWALSLGYQQSEDGIDRYACLNSGIDVVRRPTGGRAVLHANELTYAVTMRTNSTDGINAMHNKIAEAILHGLRQLGHGDELMLTSGADNIREAYKPDTLTNLACFASTARHEVTYRGKKVMGSAQRRFGDIVLQHGSIPLGPEHLRLPEFLALDLNRKAAMQRLLSQETATLSDVFGRQIEVPEAAECVASHFVEHICYIADSAS